MLHKHTSLLLDPPPVSPVCVYFFFFYILIKLSYSCEQLPRGAEVSHSDPEGEGQRRLPHGVGGKQSGPGAAESGEVQLTQTLNHFLLSRLFFDLIVCFFSQIPREDAQAFASENRIHYMEASAKNRYNVDESFLELVRIIRYRPNIQTS